MSAEASALAERLPKSNRKALLTAFRSELLRMSERGMTVVEIHAALQRSGVVFGIRTLRRAIARWAVEPSTCAPAAVPIRETESSGRALPDSALHEYVVLYRFPHIMRDLDAPFGHVCKADGSKQAKALCVQAFPSCEVVSVRRTGSYQTALARHWGMLGPNCHDDGGQDDAFAVRSNN